MSGEEAAPEAGQVEALHALLDADFNSVDALRDPDLKAFAAKTLPVIQEHTALVKKM